VLLCKVQVQTRSKRQLYISREATIWLSHQVSANETCMQSLERDRPMYRADQHMLNALLSLANKTSELFVPHCLLPDRHAA